MDLILASTSKYRRALLERLGVPFRVVSPGVDERQFDAEGVCPQRLAEELATAKAMAVARVNPNSVVIGSDQIASLGDLILGKPESIDNAVKQLTALSARSHQLITAMVVVAEGQLHSHTDITTLTMRPLDDESIRRYVHVDLPLDCAGSYKLESRGITLFESIKSQDSTAIVGLPLIQLTNILISIGFKIP